MRISKEMIHYRIDANMQYFPKIIKLLLIKIRLPKTEL